MQNKFFTTILQTQNIYKMNTTEMENKYPKNMYMPWKSLLIFWNSDAGNIVIWARYVTDTSPAKEIVTEEEKLAFKCNIYFKHLKPGESFLIYELKLR